jgi:hypothetical protein
MIRKLLISSFLASLCLPLGAQAEVSQAHENRLPENFTVYTDGSSVINHPAPGLTPVMLPTHNSYQGNQGCYVACYSHSKNAGVYSVGNNIYVSGQVRVRGSYENRICVPDGYANNDISKANKFKNLCDSTIKACKNNHCWAGGDTGGWFGIQ